MFQKNTDEHFQIFFCPTSHYHACETENDAQMSERSYIIHSNKSSNHLKIQVLTGQSRDIIKILAHIHIFLLSVVEMSVVFFHVVFTFKC